MMKTERPHRSYLTAIVACRCPRCREGKLFTYPATFRFRRNMEMHGKCPVCTQPTDIEVGFYYGTGYVSYLIGFLLSIASFLVWLMTIGFSYHDKRFLIWISLNSLFLICLQPWLMRFSRVLWLSCFVKYDPDWEHTQPEKLERIVENQMNNW